MQADDYIGAKLRDFAFQPAGFVFRTGAVAGKTARVGRLAAEMGRASGLGGARLEQLASPGQILATEAVAARAASEAEV